MSKEKLTKSDINKLFIRSTWALQLCWNYETMQGLGYCYSFMPIMEKLYKDDPDAMQKAVKLHLGFFNTEPRMSAVIFGANAALEEEYGMSNPDAIIGLKSSLMGPFAGIGDTVWGAIFKAIFYALAAQMAMAGNTAMVFLPIGAAVFRDWVRWYLCHAGYTQGRKVATSLSTGIKSLTEGANILGLTVVGALVASVVKAPLAVEFVIGTDAEGQVVTQSLQTMFNSLMPSIVPLSIVLLCYWLLSKKWMNSTKLMLFLLVLGIVLYNLHILA